MSFVKKNKSTIIAVVVFIVVLLALIQVKNIIMPEESSAIYGTRLDEIKDVKIDAKQKTTKVKKEVSESVTDASVRVAGRIINIELTVNSDVSRDSAKEEATKALKAFSSDELKYYDVQAFVQKTESSDEFPIIGYHHHSKDTFTWTKDRTGSE